MGTEGNSGAIRKDIPLALYYQLKEEIKKNIFSGEWSEGSRIPSEQEICEIYGVSRITVRKAIEELQNEKYLVKKQGRGTFVQKKAIEQKLQKFYSFSEELRSQEIREHSRVVAFCRQTPDETVRETLRLEKGREVFLIERLRYIDEKPYALEKSYIPVSLVPELTGERIQENGLYKTLGSFGVYLDHAKETFSAVNLTREEAKNLQVENKEAAINLIRVTYRGEEAVEYCKSLVRGDVFHYSVELK